MDEKKIRLSENSAKFILALSSVSILSKDNEDFT